MKQIMKRMFNLLPPISNHAVIGLISGFTQPAEEIVEGVQADPTDQNVKAISVSEWEEMLHNKSGWMGADGVYTVALNRVEIPGKADEKETMFWFSDSINY